MHFLFIYLVKMTICSGLLFTYYWSFLRNKRFHQYNRFYLLSSTVFSLLIPLIHLSWFTVQEDSLVQNAVIKVFYSQDLEPIVISNSSLDMTTIISWVAMTISTGLLLLMAVRVIQVLRLTKKYPCTHWQDIEFLDTDIDNAPFSFLKYLFWKDSIDLYSPTGQQILEHEMTHIRQKHSLDKLFLQIVTSIFWINPFFWLIKRELNILHEFLADENAIKNNDTQAFAAMLLASRYDNRLMDPTHPFAYKPIKRRLKMLTTSSKPSYSYLRRLLFLPLLFIVTGLLAITIKKHDWNEPKMALSDWAKKLGINIDRHDISDSLPMKKVNKILPDSIIIIRDNKKRDTIANVPSSKIDRVVEHLKIQGEFSGFKTADSGKALFVRGYRTDLPANKPLIVIDGVPQSNEADIHPNDIESVSIWKDKSAEALYGAKAKNGVIMIATKKGNGNGSDKVKSEKVQLEDVVVVGYGKERKIEEDEKVDKEPQFKGGAQAWKVFLMRNLHADVPASNGAPAGRIYTVILSFLVGKDGSLSDIYALNDPGFGTAEEVVRLMKESPKWEPATQAGKPVVYRQRQQVTFQVLK